MKCGECLTPKRGDSASLQSRRLCARAHFTRGVWAGVPFLKLDAPSSGAKCDRTAKSTTLWRGTALAQRSATAVRATGPPIADWPSGRLSRPQMPIRRSAVPNHPKHPDVPLPAAGRPPLECGYALMLYFNPIPPPKQHTITPYPPCPKALSGFSAFSGFLPGASPLPCPTASVFIGAIGGSLFFGRVRRISAAGHPPAPGGHRGPLRVFSGCRACPPDFCLWRVRAEF